MGGNAYSYGPSSSGGGIDLRVFAPEKGEVALSLQGKPVPMEKDDGGIWHVSLPAGSAGKTYGFMVDGEGPFPDPASRYMPSGIGGLPELTDPATLSGRRSSWKGLPLEDYVIEEIHVGTFTPLGTFRSAEEKLGFLEKQGITAVEIMPVAEFYGSRNWGYDGVYLYSPHYTYGRPEDLIHLVDAIHSHGMSAILDVVYNHSGPVGNYLERFAPYYSTMYGNQWGKCFNLDGPYSDHIREYILQNVIFWLDIYGFDALRLDAVHGIIDHSPVHLLEEMASRVRDFSSRTGRKAYLIAESDQNNGRMTLPPARGGTGIDAQWNDDFHHVLHTTLTGELDGYYMDYGCLDDVEKVMNRGFLYQGEYSRYLKKRRGTEWHNTPERLVVFSQNHDQIGNRALGERLISLAGERKARLAASITLLSPYTPLIFMGEELGSTTPFLYFIQTEDRVFADAVYRGRYEEFRNFGWSHGVPDPNADESFQSSRIDWDLTENEKGRAFIDLYRELIAVRKKYILKHRGECHSSMGEDRLLRTTCGQKLLLFSSFREDDSVIPVSDGAWECIFNSEWRRFGGSAGEERLIESGIKVPGYSTVALLSL